MKKSMFVLIILIAIMSGFYFLKQYNKQASPIPSGDDITLAITSDIHYLSRDLNDGKEAFQKYISKGDGKQLYYIAELFDTFIDQLKQTKPKVLILSGDLTNNGELDSHKDLAEKLKELEKTGTSIYVIPGNHDILNPWARGFKNNNQYVTDYIDEKEFVKIYADYGYKEAIMRDKATLSYLAAPSEDLWLLMLDTNKYKNNLALGYPETDGVLSKSTLDWINECHLLAEEKGAEIVAVMHHNILHHSNVIREGYTLNNNEQSRLRLKGNNINLVFSGHIHIQDISFDQQPNNPLYDIASGALSVYPHQYGNLIYTAKDKSLEYSTTRLDVEQWAKQNDMNDQNLLNFTKYSEDYFNNISYNMAYRRLEKEGSYTEEEMKQMSEIVQILNMRYFSGTENINSEDILQSKGYELWSGYEEGFFREYLYSISKDEDMEDTSLQMFYNHVTIN
jgi:3',5'-cyclic AMP phosphodiesterase CpdA